MLAANDPDRIRRELGAALRDCGTDGREGGAEVQRRYLRIYDRRHVEE